MNLLNIFKNFKNDESGAVTVDWVVLTGAVVGLALIIGTTVNQGVQDAAGNIAGQLTANTAAGTGGTTTGGTTTGG